MAENSSQIKKEISDSGKANDIELNDIKQDQNQSAEKKDGCTSREKDLQNLVEDVRDYAATRKFNKAVYLMHGRHYFESESEASSSLEERDEFLTEKPVEGDGTWQEFHEKDAKGVDFFDYEGEASDDEQREGEISDEQPLEGEISDEEQQRVGEIFYNYEGPGFEHQNEKDKIPDEHRGPGFEREDIEQRQTNCRRITIIVLLISMICAAAVVIFFVTKRDDDDPNNLNKFIKEDKTSDIQNIENSTETNEDTNIQEMKNSDIQKDQNSAPNEIEDEKNDKTSKIQQEIKENGENKKIPSEDQKNAQKSSQKSVRNPSAEKQKNTKSNKLISAAKTGLGVVGVGLVAGLGTLATKVYKSVTKSSKKHEDKFTNHNDTKHKGDVKEVDSEDIPHGSDVNTCKNEHKTSKGLLILHDGEYEGDFKEVEGEKTPHGSGVYTYNINPKRKQKYEGEFKNGKRSGRGTMTETVYDWDGDEDKSIYSGEWKKDRREGYGSQVKQKSGTGYIGYWKDDDYHGRGVFDLKSDRPPKHDGNWIYGHRHGHGVCTDTNGKTFEADFKFENGIPFALDLCKDDNRNEKPSKSDFEKHECPERPHSYTGTAASYMTRMDPLIHKPHFKGRVQSKRTAYKKSVPQPLSELSAFKKHIVQQKANIK